MYANHSIVCTIKKIIHHLDDQIYKPDMGKLYASNWQKKHSVVALN